MSVEITPKNGRIERPCVKGQREIVADHRNLVRLGCFFHQGRGAAAVGTLQVLKHHDGYGRALRWTQGRIHRALRGCKRASVPCKDSQKEKKLSPTFCHDSCHRVGLRSKLALNTRDVPRSR